MPWNDWSPFPWIPVFPFFFMLIGLAVFLFVMIPTTRRQNPRRDRDVSPRSALDILNERYARGKIDKTEYEEKRRALS